MLVKKRTSRNLDLDLSPLPIAAAAAELAEVPVCHYHPNFELIAEVTGQPVRAIAPLGSL